MSVSCAAAHPGGRSSSGACGCCKHELCHYTYRPEITCCSRYFSCTGPGLSRSNLVATYFQRCWCRQLSNNSGSSSRGKQPLQQTSSWNSSEHEHKKRTPAETAAEGFGDDPTKKAVLPYGVRGPQSWFRGRGPLPRGEFRPLLQRRARVQGAGPAPSGWLLRWGLKQCGELSRMG